MGGNGVVEVEGWMVWFGGSRKTRRQSVCLFVCLSLTLLCGLSSYLFPLRPPYRLSVNFCLSGCLSICLSYLLFLFLCLSAFPYIYCSPSLSFRYVCPHEYICIYLCRVYARISQIFHRKKTAVLLFLRDFPQRKKR